jgi:hypothetical protein
VTSPRVDQATEIVAELTDALADDPDTTGAVATTDALLVPSGARNGIVLVQPPDLTFTNFQFTDPTWTLLVVAGPPDNHLAAWERIDAIIHALETAGINLATGEPVGFQPLDKNAPLLPAYQLTLNPI